MLVYDRVKELCEKEGISINELSKLIGIDRGAIAKWNESSPSLSNIAKVAEHFKLPIDEFANRSIHSQHNSGVINSGSNNIFFNKEQSEMESNHSKKRE